MIRLLSLWLPLGVPFALGFAAACSDDTSSSPGADGGASESSSGAAGWSGQGGNAFQGGFGGQAESAGGHAGGQPERPEAEGGAGGGGAFGMGGSAGVESEGGNGGDTNAPNPPTTINGCATFVDRTADNAARTVPWNEDLIYEPVRCMQVRVGQSVTFNGDLDNHPMLPSGGDAPSPLGAAVATFTAPGTYGYRCIPHPSEMNGAIRVVGP